VHGEPEISQSVIYERNVRLNVSTRREDESTIVGIQRLAVITLKRALLRHLPSSENTILVIIEARLRRGPSSSEHFHAGLEIQIEEHGSQTVTLLDSHPRENVLEGQSAVHPEKEVRVKGHDQADEM
jgi:hypothetical protein